MKYRKYVLQREGGREGERRRQAGGDHDADDDDDDRDHDVNVPEQFVLLQRVIGGSLL